MYDYQELSVDGKEGLTSHQPTTGTQIYIIPRYTQIFFSKIAIENYSFPSNIYIIDFTQLLGVWGGGVGISGEEPPQVH